MIWIPDTGTGTGKGPQQLATSRKATKLEPTYGTPGSAGAPAIKIHWS
jgi:hypothetical protein